MLKKLAKWQILRNFIGENQIVMNKIQPFGQVRSIEACAPNHTAKVRNKFDTRCSIFEELKTFASSVPDFRRLDKGNIRHRLDDIIMLMKDALRDRGLEEKVNLSAAFCLGKCTDGVSIKVEDEIISGVNKENFEQIFDRYIASQV